MADVKMMQGCDLSHWDAARYKNILMDETTKFAIIKATEGKTGFDRYCDIIYNFYTSVHDRIGTPAADRMYGFYHYARPERNTPEEEARNYLSRVGHRAGKAMFCLDWEGNAWKHSPRWARAWLDYVFRETGVRPLLYTSSSYLRNLGVVAEGNYGLWVAAYRKTKPAKLAPWKFCAMWQYTSEPYDHDLFYGNADTWKKYITPVKG